MHVTARTILAPAFRARPLLRRCHRLLASVGRDRRGISVVEFALSLPFVITFGAMGVEVAYMASINMQVSQLALSVADNASRLGQTDNSAVAPTISEQNIDAIMFGAMKEGASFNFQQNGRIILSSLEKDKATGKQYIHWQRCAGSLARNSSYGNDSNNNGLNGVSFPDGLGRPGHQVKADDGQAVMFVEVYYRYQPLFAGMLGQQNFKREAAFLVRDDRNLTGGGGDGLTGTPVSTC
jgi:hypothetical protein